MRDGSNIRFGENCADVLADLHQGRLEQLDGDHHDDDAGGADDDQGQLRQLEVLLIYDQEEAEMEEEL